MNETIPLTLREESIKNQPHFKRVILWLLAYDIQTPLRLCQYLSTVAWPNNSDLFYAEDEWIATMLIHYFRKNNIYIDHDDQVIEYMVYLYNNKIGWEKFQAELSRYLLEIERFDHL